MTPEDLTKQVNLILKDIKETNTKESFVVWKVEKFKIRRSFFQWFRDLFPKRKWTQKIIVETEMSKSAEQRMKDILKK